MRRPYGSRMLLVISCALAILLAGLAAVQYRWSARVAAADAEREREHLNSALALFATEFNGLAGRAMGFLENQARTALQADQPLPPLPKPIGELYYLERPVNGAPVVRKLTPQGVFAAAPLPGWMDFPHCSPIAVDQPPAFVTPIFDIATSETNTGLDNHVRSTVRWRQDRCFVAVLDQPYLTTTLIPQLILQSFGATSVREYDFSVVWRKRPAVPLYGATLRADLRMPFFALQNPLTSAGAPFPSTTAPGRMLVVRRIETVATQGRGNVSDLLGPGIWELQLAHKGMPLAQAFEQTRRRNLLLSIAVEALMLAAIVFLVFGTVRIERLADQKMRFVAGVSHELRTPVSAIAMLSRNQQDGLVTGAEKVRQYGELIHQQSRRLNEMVEQTLQYAGIHSGVRRPLRSPVDLAGLIREAVDARRDQLAAAGFEVEIAISPDLPPVAGDAALLATAFDNLLTNALKHAGSGRWIRVSAAFAAADREVRISVVDRGAGIDPADRDGIFEPFARGRAAVEAQIPGSGLGLSLVRSAAEAHRGAITLESQPGQGSTFTLHLPV